MKRRLHKGRSVSEGEWEGAWEWFASRMIGRGRHKFLQIPDSYTQHIELMHIFHTLYLCLSCDHDLLIDGAKPLSRPRCLLQFIGLRKSR